MQAFSTRLRPMSSYTAQVDRRPTVVPGPNAQGDSPEPSVSPPLRFYDRHRMQKLLSTQQSTQRQFETRVRFSPVEYKNQPATCIQMLSYTLHATRKTIVALTRDPERIDAIVRAELGWMASLDPESPDYQAMLYRFAVTDSFDREPDIRT